MLPSRQMKPSIAILCVVALLSACAAPPRLTMPPAIEGGWTLAGEASATAPDEIAKLGVTAAKTYRYTGPVEVNVAVYEMTSDTVAFEAFQKLRVPPNGMPFYKKRWLVVPTTSQPAPGLAGFARALQASL